MAKRLYEEFGMNLDEIVGSEVEALLKHAGQTYKISGLVFQGNEQTFLVMFPTACELDFSEGSYEPPFYVLFDDVLNPSIQELQEILKRTDDPLIFQHDETGVLKAIVRKSQRVISGAVQQKIWYRDGYQCMYCGRGIPDVQLTVDHWIPLEMEGVHGLHNLNHPGNYLSACRACNKAKGNQKPEEFCKKHNIDYTGLTLYLSGKAPKSFLAHLQK